MAEVHCANPRLPNYKPKTRTPPNSSAQKLTQAQNCCSNHTHISTKEHPQFYPQCNHCNIHPETPSHPYLRFLQHAQHQNSPQRQLSTLHSSQESQPDTNILKLIQKQILESWNTYRDAATPQLKLLYHQLVLYRHLEIQKQQQQQIRDPYRYNTVHESRGAAKVWSTSTVLREYTPLSRLIGVDRGSRISLYFCNSPLDSLFLFSVSMHHHLSVPLDSCNNLRDLWVKSNQLAAVLLCGRTGFDICN